MRGMPVRKMGADISQSKIVSAKFAGTKRLERHRMVYSALGSLMQTDIHALSVNALSPDESR